MMTDHEYKEWFAKYLGDVESPHGSDNDSLISNIPRPFKSRNWMIINSLILLITFVGSLFLSWLNSCESKWYYEWGYNALLNISFGLLVSILIFIYTNLRDRNIAYYSDVIPLLKKRYNDMHTAYFQYNFKLERYKQGNKVEEFYDAWHIQSNTGFVIIGFFEYLIGISVFDCKKYNIDTLLLNTLSDQILDANRKIQEEYLHHNTISEKTYEICIEAMMPSFSLLMVLNEFIGDLENQLFTIKYDKHKLTKEEQEFNNNLYKIVSNKKDSK